MTEYLYSLNYTNHMIRRCQTRIRTWIFLSYYWFCLLAQIKFV